MKTGAKCFITFLATAFFASTGRPGGLKTLHDFEWATGWSPTYSFGLTVVDNALFGTTEGLYGGGSVFKIKKDGGSFTNLHSLASACRLAAAGDTLYGTTRSFDNPTFPHGTVFKMQTDGSGFTILHVFDGTNGDDPLAGVTLAGETLYGSAGQVVFKMHTDGSQFEVLHRFTMSTNASGLHPRDLTLAGNTLYGTTEIGGDYVGGSVFRLNTDGSSFATLHIFRSDEGTYLGARLLLIGDTLYGTAGEGGAYGGGTIFAVNTNGAGFAVIHNFLGAPIVHFWDWDCNCDSWYQGPNEGGAFPTGGLILSENALCGITELGGQNALGTVFKLGLSHFVDPNSTNPVAPFLNWASAATNIQDAIDTAEPGDEVVVTNGVYSRGGTAAGRVVVTNAVSIRSVNGPEVTAIIGDSGGDSSSGLRCVYLADGASLDGFTITNGYNFLAGGGVFCESTNAQIASCIISGNSVHHQTDESLTTSGEGGGVYSGTLTNCILVGNSAGFGGGAAYSVLRNCVIATNKG